MRARSAPGAQWEADPDGWVATSLDEASSDQTCRLSRRLQLIVIRRRRSRRLNPRRPFQGPTRGRLRVIGSVEPVLELVMARKAYTLSCARQRRRGVVRRGREGDVGEDVGSRVSSIPVECKPAPARWVGSDGPIAVLGKASQPIKNWQAKKTFPRRSGLGQPCELKDALAKAKVVMKCERGACGTAIHCTLCCCWQAPLVCQTAAGVKRCLQNGASQVPGEW